MEKPETEIPKDGGLSATSQKLLYLQGWQPELFWEVVASIGPLMPSAQDQLLVSLDKIAFTYQTRSLEKVQATPSQKITRAGQIAKASGRLLSLLGVDDPKSVAGDPMSRHSAFHPVTLELSLELERIAEDRRPESRVGGTRLTRLYSLVGLLADLVEAVDRVSPELEKEAERLRKEVDPGIAIGTKSSKSRGGVQRKGKTPEGQLLHELVDLYASHRGNLGDAHLAVDDQLRAFIRAALRFMFTQDAKLAPLNEVVDKTLYAPTRLTDEAIRAAANRWRAQTKSRVKSI
jgi:hypothetical protein